MENDKFPKSVTDFAEDLLNTCRKHGLRKFTGTIRANSFDNDDCHGWDEITFRWESGRHGAAMNKIDMWAKKDMRIELKSGQAWPG